MLEQAQDTVSDGEQFIPVMEAAASLRLSPRKLKRLLAQRGLGLYLFGTRTQRVRASDLQQLIRAAAQEPVSQ